MAGRAKERLDNTRIGDHTQIGHLAIVRNAGQNDEQSANRPIHRPGLNFSAS
jgi:hypothetical protein